jgi:Flagellar hook-associated protein
VGQVEEIADYYERIQILIGEPGSENSIDEYTQSFFNALQKMAESPDRVSMQAAAIDTAEVLARELSGLARSMEDLRFQADQDIDEAVKAVNLQISELDNLNVAIERANALSLPTGALLDERDIALDNIASHLNINVYFRESGAVNVFTSAGVALVDDARNELQYVPANGLNEFVNDNPMNPLEVVTFDNNGNVTSRRSIISGGTESAVSSSLNGGAIEGLRELRDEIIPDILAQLDTLAANLRDAINEVHNDGSGFPPASELSGTRLVTANEEFDWTGTAQITLLSADGSPIPPSA